MTDLLNKRCVYGTMAAFITVEMLNAASVSSVNCFTRSNRLRLLDFCGILASFVVNMARTALLMATIRRPIHGPGHNGPVNASGFVYTRRDSLSTKSFVKNMEDFVSKRARVAARCTEAFNANA